MMHQQPDGGAPLRLKTARREPDLLLWWPAAPECCRIGAKPTRPEDGEKQADPATDPVKALFDTSD